MSIKNITHIEIVVGAGCFWGVEKYFSQIPGVLVVTAGYAGGDYANPTYDSVLENSQNQILINHNEVVKIIYDDAIITTQILCQHFWEIHNPTQINGQGGDIGNNYRSAIYFTTTEQKVMAFETKEKYQKLLTIQGFGEIITEIKALNKFYPAEEYHQKYLIKNPNGYCPNHSTGVKFL